MPYRFSLLHFLTGKRPRKKDPLEKRRAPLAATHARSSSAGLRRRWSSCGRSAEARDELRERKHSEENEAGRAGWFITSGHGSVKMVSRADKSVARVLTDSKTKREGEA